MNKLLALCITLLASGNYAYAQSPAPSKRIMSVCDAFVAQLGDLSRLAGTITDRDDLAGVMGMASVAELNSERCVSIHSLLFVYERLSPGTDRTGAGNYVAFRMEQYAALKTDGNFANDVFAQSKGPAVRREAGRLRNQLRAFSDTIRALKPN